MLGRYSSEIRTGCANERPSGSVRGAISNGRPYRDQQLVWAVRILWGSALVGRIKWHRNSVTSTLSGDNSFFIVPVAQPSR